MSKDFVPSWLPLGVDVPAWVLVETKTGSFAIGKDNQLLIFRTDDDALAYYKANPKLQTRRALTKQPQAASFSPQPEPRPK